MTRRERMERRLARRQEWAAGRRDKAAGAFKAADRATEGIPFGQPILVGHHSERHHRRALDRQDSAMRRGIEHSDMAKHHASKAGGLAHALERSVFTDDPDAPERLRERIAENEAKAADHAAINKAWRKGGAAAIRGLVLPSGHTCSEKLAARAEETMRLASWLKTPLDTTNLRAAIRRDRARLVEVERIAAERARCAEALAEEGYDQL